MPGGIGIGIGADIPGMPFIPAGGFVPAARFGATPGFFIPGMPAIAPVSGRGFAGGFCCAALTVESSARSTNE